MTQPSLLAQVRSLVTDGIAIYRGSMVASRLATLAARLDEPLRVVVAGPLKAGKSTLLNALVGEELAPTDAGECTRVVTWYRHGPTYRVGVLPREGEAFAARFSRQAGALHVDLAGRQPAEISRIVIEWPSPRLEAMTLIDTPGLQAATGWTSEATWSFVAPGDEATTPADAVIYLLRHFDSRDVRFLEAFHDRHLASATPVNAVAVLSRADEVGAARLDALESARRIANRLSAESEVRRLCHTVVPVAGLLAQAGATLRQDEYEALAVLARAPAAQTEVLLVSVDRFALPDTVIPLSGAQRRALLERLGIFGVRLAVDLIRQGGVRTAPQLAAELLRRSGIQELRDVLTAQFAVRSDVLRARSALHLMPVVLEGHEAPDSSGHARELERIRAGAHELAELELIACLRQGRVALAREQAVEAERLVGGNGTSLHTRLGVDARAGQDELRAAGLTQLTRWRRFAENPLVTPDEVDAARIVIRTLEGTIDSLR